jgi:hypothetical protein
MSELECRSTNDSGFGKLLKCGDKRDEILWVTFLKIHPLTNLERGCQDVDCVDRLCVEIGLGSFVVADCIISGVEPFIALSQFLLSSTVHRFLS